MQLVRLFQQNGKRVIIAHFLCRRKEGRLIIGVSECPEMEIDCVDPHVCHLLKALAHSITELICRLSGKNLPVVQIGKPHPVYRVIVVRCCFGVIRRAVCGAAGNVQLFHLLDVFGDIVAESGVFRYALFSLCGASAQEGQQKG